MRAIVEDRDIGLSEKTRDCSERAAKAAIEQHSVFASKELCDLALQLPMKIGHAGKHGRAARTKAVAGQSILGRSDHFGMVGQPKIIVGTKIDDRARFSVVGDVGARFGRRE
jgi:hypothetical protein